MDFGRDFTKTIVTLAQEGVRGSSWALEYVEFRGESISGTFRANPIDLGARILKKIIFFGYFRKKYIIFSLLFLIIVSLFFLGWGGWSSSN